MKTKEQVFEEILADQAITDAVLEVSRTFQGEWKNAFAPYFRTAAALADCITRMDLPGEHCAPGAEGIACLLPYITIGMPSLNDGFTSHWGDEYLRSKGVEEIFFEEAGLEARTKGEAGEPNYLYGLLILDTVGDIIVQLAGTHLMVAAAVNIDKGLTHTAGDMPEVH